MKKIVLFSMLLLCALVIYTCGEQKPKSMVVTGTAAATSGITAFQNNRGVLPPASEYSGPLFALSHDYPAVLPPPLTNPPWIQALKGQPIGPGNALAYVEALKTFVTPSVRKFLYDRANWNSAAEHWYQEPWTGALRESILGTYTGSSFGPNTFSNLDSAMTTYVLTMYDQTAGHTLYNMWGSTASNLNLLQNAAQFAQGSVIIKYAFTTANYPLWNSMQNALTLPIYDTCTYCGPGPNPYALRNVSLFQFDIIVKDTITAPKTGWVFSTLVYDKNAPGKDAWEKMVPLGAMWGNDPDVNSTTNPKQALKETVINPKAPAYSTETLGWGGRLSGPNDGAVIPSAKLPNGMVVTNLAASSCMSCHSVAQAPCCQDADTLSAFLLPTYWASLPPPSAPANTPMPVFEPGGTQWFQYFQDREGSQPFTPGQVAVDFDMVTCFKSMLMMYSAQQGKTVEEAARLVSRRQILANRAYNGRVQ